MGDQPPIAAVLAGGLGERLGGSKASATLAGRPLVEHPLGAAGEAGLEAIVVAKRSTVLPPLDVPVVYEPQRPQHPLLGVITAHNYSAAHPSATNKKYVEDFKKANGFRPNFISTGKPR